MSLGEGALSFARYFTLACKLLFSVAIVASPRRERNASALLTRYDGKGEEQFTG